MLYFTTQIKKEILHSYVLKVNETYNRSIDPIPSYISSLTSPIRKKHKDDLLVTKTPVRDFDF